MSMAVSLESRLPLLDHRLTELVFRMPPRFKYRDGKSKAVLLAAASPFLPEAVLNRHDKMGFPVPFVEWAQGPLREFITDILLGQAREALAKRVQGKVLKEAADVLEDYTGKSCKIEAGDGSILYVKIFLVDTRIYTLMAGVAEESETSQGEIGKFFASFSLLR